MRIGNIFGDLYRFIGLSVMFGCIDVLVQTYTIYFPLFFLYIFCRNLDNHN